MNRSHKSKYNSLLNLEDAAEFMHNLSFQPLSEAIYYVRLHLLIPCGTTEMVNAKWCDINLNSARHWMIKNPKLGNAGEIIGLPCIAELSESAIQCLLGLKQFTGNNQYYRAPLFPELSAMKKSERDKLIAQTIQNIWRHYPIEITSFKPFVEEVANKYGFFESAFIRQAIANKCKNHPNRGALVAFALQKRAFSNWWCGLLEFMTKDVPYNRS
jgi:hypothetical protein